MLDLRILDGRYEELSEAQIVEALDSIASKKIWQVQIRCDGQLRAEYYRSRIFDLCMKRPEQWQLTILGMGGAVGIKILPRDPTGGMVYDPDQDRVVTRDEWNKSHPNNQVR